MVSKIQANIALEIVDAMQRTDDPPCRHAAFSFDTNHMVVIGVMPKALRHVYNLAEKKFEEWEASAREYAKLDREDAAFKTEIDLLKKEARAVSTVWQTALLRVCDYSSDTCKAVGVLEDWRAVAVISTEGLEKEIFRLALFETADFFREL